MTNLEVEDWRYSDFKMQLRRQALSLLIKRFGSELNENGEPKFVTDTGTQNPNDYSITFRTKRTAGRTGGGCQLSFTGDGEVGDIDLNDDSDPIYKKQHCNGHNKKKDYDQDTVYSIPVVQGI